MNHHFKYKLPVICLIWCFDSNICLHSMLNDNVNIQQRAGKFLFDQFGSLNHYLGFQYVSIYIFYIT